MIFINNIKNNNIIYRYINNINMDNINKNIYEMRIDYDSETPKLVKSSVDSNPFKQFNLWFSEAVKTEKVIEPNSMTISTIDSDGYPISRMVLLKHYNTKEFVFFSNYNSIKGKNLENNNKICLNFYWPTINRQVRIKGDVYKIDESESEEYFNSRPVLSRLSASISKQSEVLEDRLKFEAEYKELCDKKDNIEIKRPSNWGGYSVIPKYFEFWQGRRNRLHERVSYSLINNDWELKDLYP